MKKLIIFVIVLCGIGVVQAQNQVNSFFDEMGLLRLETEELSELSDTIVKVKHRSEDIAWSRVVYRIVDMRYKQNFQLYTPIDYDQTYSSLLKVMLLAIADGMPIYIKSNTENDIKPDFNSNQKISGNDILDCLDSSEDRMKDEDVRTDERVLAMDSLGDLIFVQKNFKNFAKNQLKYLVQEVIFFDKHYSRMYSKIMAIAPLRADHSNMTEDMDVMDALYGQILFWVPFDLFRPYMAQQYIMPNRNDSKRITFDDFFTQKLYTSYLVGASNVRNRMIPEYAETREDILKEQERIEWELLSAEQDLWEY